MSLSAKDINTIDASWQLYDAERMANERLRQQLAEKDAEIHRLQMALADTEALELGTNEQLSVAASEILALRAANKECVEYFNEMKKDLAKKDAEIEWLKAEHATAYKLVDYWQKKSAAIQAHELQLREALETYADEWDRHWKQDMPILQPLSDKALSLPQDTSALEAVVQKAGEVMRERCLSEIDPKYYTHDLLKEVVEDCCGDLRALPGVTLEDLK